MTIDVFIFFLLLFFLLLATDEWPIGEGGHSENVELRTHQKMNAGQELNALIRRKVSRGR